MKNWYLSAASALSLFAAPASAAPIVLANHGFESADLTGWSSLGDAAAVPGAVLDPDNLRWYVGPDEHFMAQLDTASASVEAIEAFLGIGGGSLQAGSTSLLTVGSAIYQDFAANA